MHSPFIEKKAGRRFWKPTPGRVGGTRYVCLESELPGPLKDSVIKG